MKKLFLLVIASLVIFLLAACGDVNDKPVKISGKQSLEIGDVILPAKVVINRTTDATIQIGWEGKVTVYLDGWSSAMIFQLPPEKSGQYSQAYYTLLSEQEGKWVLEVKWPEGTTGSFNPK